MPINRNLKLRGQGLPGGSDPQMLSTITDGQVAAWSAANRRWEAVTSVPDSLSNFGAVGDEVTDDTVAIQSAINSSDVIYWPSDKRYLISRTDSLVIPAGQVWIGKAKFRFLGTAGAYDTPFNIGDNCDIETIDWLTENGTSGRVMFIGAGTRLGLIRGIVESGGDQHTDTGIVTLGQDVKIGRVESRGYDRPMQVNNTGVTPTTGFDLGFLDVDLYVRALNLINMADFRVGGYRIRGRSPNTILSQPGHNGMLLDSIFDGEIGDGRIEHAGEHAVRFAGTSSSGPVSSNIKMGVIQTLAGEGCPLKINPGEGLIEHISVDGIVAIDAGEGSVGGNTEVARISHARDISIGYISSTLMNESTSGRSILRLNDVIGLDVGLVSGTVNDRAIHIDKASDATVDNPGNDVKDVRIGGFRVNTLSASVVYIDMAGFEVGDIYIEGMAVTGTESLLAFVGSPTITGPIYLQGVASTASQPSFDSLPDDSNLQADILWGERRFVGQMSDDPRFGSQFQFIGGSFDPSDVTYSPDVTLYGMNGTPGAGEAGSALSFTRVGSRRRGAAVVPVQETTDVYSIGLEFYTGPTTIATDLLLHAATLTWERDFRLEGPGKGLILTSPDGSTTKRIAIDNTGAIITENP